MGQQLVNAIVLGSVLTLFTLGLSLAWGTLDVLNLAHGAIFVLAGYLAYDLTKSTSLPFVPVLLLSMIGSGLAAVAMELVAFRWIRSRFVVKRQAELSMLVASIGGSIVINQFVANQTDNQGFSPGPRLFNVTSHEILGLRITNIQILIVVCAVVIAIALDA